jgi:hypothetical protein
MIISPATTPPVTEQAIVRRRAIPALASAGVLVASLILAFTVNSVQSFFPNRNESAVLFTGVLLAGLLAAAPGVYVLRMGRRARPDTAGLLFLAASCVCLLAVYFFWIAPYVFFPADILIWSESGFVNNILKFKAGFPQYTPPANLDSDHYVLGPQFLTWFLASLAGKGNSIAAFRVVQLGYTALAAFFAVLCCRRIIHIARPDSRVTGSWIWNVFWYAALLLMATNSITNRFAHNLHGDALAQSAAMVTFYLLLVYMDTRRFSVLAALALLVPVNFMIKQNLLIWPLFVAVWLAIGAKSWKTAVSFLSMAAGLFGVAAATCYAVWGGPFVYWIFRELSQHAVSPLRAFQHMLDSWTYLAAGLLGGAVVLRHSARANLLTGAWLIWLAFICVEAYTSGIEWMLNHLGPGCLIGGVWFLAGLAIWASEASARRDSGIDEWIAAAAVTGAVALAFSGLGLIRIPLRSVSPDAYRYVHDIEKQFDGRPAGGVLLDVGSWVYMKDRIVMGDRAAIAGMIGMTRTPDFSGIRSRIAAKRYSRILVRDLHNADFWYDNALWPKPSGLRETLLDNYREAGVIPAAMAPKDVKTWAEDPYLFDEITILEPK